MIPYFFIFIKAFSFYKKMLLPIKKNSDFINSIIAFNNNNNNNNNKLSN